jgi:hypothetical protein
LPHFHILKFVEGVIRRLPHTAFDKLENMKIRIKKLNLTDDIAENVVLFLFSPASNKKARFAGAKRA